MVFFHGGWGKIDAAAGTQYAIDRWRPALLINLGTCGGFAGDIAAGEVLLVDFTLVYDIVEQMGDPDEALAHYATAIDLSWLGRPWPLAARQELLVSADRDIVAAEVAELRARYGAIAADWESGAIAHVCGRNGTRCLIPVSYTHLDVYKRQGQQRAAIFPVVHGDHIAAELAVEAVVVGSLQELSLIHI